VSNLWDRQDYDTPPSYAAFRLYLEQGPRRSLRQTSILHYGDKDGEGSGKIRQVEKWSAEKNWVARVAAYDAYQHQKDAEAYEKKRRKAKEDRITILDYAMHKLTLGLKQFDPENETVKIADMVRMMQVVFDQQRAEYGDTPADRVDLTSGGLPLQQASPAFLDAIVRRAASELDEFHSQFATGDDDGGDE